MILDQRSPNSDTNPIPPNCKAQPYTLPDPPKLKKRIKIKMKIISKKYSVRESVHGRIKTLWEKAYRRQYERERGK
jgi:hypothetical protein